MTKADIFSQNVILNNIETELRKIKKLNFKISKFEICLPVL